MFNILKNNIIYYLFM